MAEGGLVNYTRLDDTQELIVSTQAGPFHPTTRFVWSTTKARSSRPEPRGGTY